MFLSNLIKAFFETFITPVILTILTLVALHYSDQYNLELDNTLLATPFAILLATLLLSLRFNRNNMVFILATLLFSYWCISQTISAPNSTAFVAIFSMTATLIPFNYLAFSVIKNKIIFSRIGIIKTLVVALEFLLIYNITIANPASTRDFFSVLIWSSPEVTAPSLPNLATLFMILALIVVAIKWLFKRSHVESSLICSLILLSLTHSMGATPALFLLSYSSAGLIIAIGILQNSYNMAYRDELTNIPGRRALNEYLVSLGRNYTIAMLDIDFFKKFNDDYGHAVGDQVLQLVASKMKKITGGGKAFRYGGEEFAIVFNRIPAKKALSHLEDLRQNIADYQMSIRSRLRPKKNSKGKQHRSTFKIARIVQITLSIGLAERNEKNINTDEVIKAADKALYKAKNKGRDQVCF